MDGILTDEDMMVDGSAASYGWRPIETCGVRGCVVLVAREHVEAAYLGDVWKDLRGNVLRWEPTHWCPLPPAPWRCRG